MGFALPIRHAGLRKYEKLEVFLISVLVSILISAYYGWFGSIEPEESMHIGFSIAAGMGGEGLFDGPRHQGTFSVLGVPLYDGLQGVGDRLPYKGGWFSSIEWPFRLIVDYRMYVLVRIFLSTFVFLWLSAETLRSWSPRVSRVKLLSFCCLLISPAPIYLRWDEWSVEWSQSAAIFGVAMFFLREELFSGLTRSQSDMFLSNISWISLAVALIYLATGHPGLLPIAVFVLVSLIATACMVSRAYRGSLRMFLRQNRLRTSLLIAAPLWSIVTTFLELRSEFSQLGDWTSSRRRETGQWYSDQAFLGLSRGILPAGIERFLSELFSQAFLPLARPLFQLFPEVDALRRTGGSFPQGQFTALAVMVLASWLILKMKRNSPRRQLYSVIVVAQVSIYVLASLAAQGRLPLSVTPSGAWKVFPLLLMLNVFLAAALLTSSTRQFLFARALLLANLGLVFVYLLMQLGFLTGTGTLQIPERIQSLATTSEADQLPPDSRTVFIAFDTPGDDNTMLSTQSFGILLAGKPLLQSAAVMRDTTNMKVHIPAEGGYGFLSPLGRSVTELNTLLSFFQVETVLVQDDTAGRHFIVGQQGSFSRGRHSDRLPVLWFRGYKFLVWDRPNYFYDVIVKGTLEDTRICPILEQMCPIVYRTERVNYSDTPRLRTCSDPCIWKYQANKLKSDETLVLPIAYDPSLTVTNENTQVIPARDIAGFMGISGIQLGNDEALEVSVRPDVRMWALVAASYLSLFCPVLLVFSLRRKS